MKRTHALVIALAVAVAAVAGTFAAMRTVHLGARARTTSVSTAQIARQNKLLDRAEAALHAQLRHRPPAIPALHATPAPAPVAAAPVTVIYHRPAPIVHVVHRAGGEHDDGEGGGADD